MQSTVETVLLPPVGTLNVGPLYTGDNTLPVRLYIRNNGGVNALLAFSTGALNGAAGGSIGKTFVLPADRDITLILQPTQQVYAVGAGVGVTLSYAASVALPLGGTS